MKTEIMIELLETDIASAKEELKREEDGYPFMCGWLEGCIKHMEIVIDKWKESNYGKDGNL